MELDKITLSPCKCHCNVQPRKISGERFDNLYVYVKFLSYSSLHVCWELLPHNIPLVYVKGRPLNVLFCLKTVLPMINFFVLSTPTTIFCECSQNCFIARHRGQKILDVSYWHLVNFVERQFFTPARFEE